MRKFAGSAGRCGRISQRAAGSLKGNAEPPREVLHVLPGHPPRARAARRCPFERFAAQVLDRERDAVMADIALDHGEILVLAAAVEAEPEAEAVRQRHAL